MKINRVIIGVVILAIILSGCSAKTADQPVGNVVRDGGAPSVAPMEAPMAEQFATDSSKSAGLSASTVAFEQMVIMNADLSIAVDDPTVSMATIQKMAKDLGGFTVSSNLFKTQTASGLEVPEASITIRVPAERLDEAMEKIKALTGDPVKFTLYENITGQDVTQQYTDLKSRLRNLEEADAKLSEFYKQATKTEDALAIYAQKMQITEQIEVIKGQMQYYEQSSSKSAISVRIQAKASVTPITIAGWQPSGVARKALQALINFGKGLVDFIIWLGIFVLPVVLIFGLPIFFLVRWLMRRNRRNQAAKMEALRKAMKDQQPPLPS